MKILFIGGTGIISSACSQLALEKGIDLYHLNRGKSSGIRRVLGVRTLVADIHDESAVRDALGSHEFDAVVDWIAFRPEDVRRDIRLFAGRTGQFVFISSASAYQTPPVRWPITEDTPLENPFWAYSRDKIACERILRDEYASTRFPATIVRPSHTYDRTLLPFDWGYNVVSRMKERRPVIVHGDGSSLWTLTHHRDFAVGLVGLLGRNDAVGRAFHITSDEWLSWDRIYRIVADALDVSPELVHIPSEVLAGYDSQLGESLLGDKAHSMVFDNSRIKAFVPEFNPRIPFAEGVQEVLAWYDEDPSRQSVDPEVDLLIDRIITDRIRL